MFIDIPRELLEAYSNREISRREIGDRMGVHVGFGDVLAGLHQHGLKLPRYPVDRDSPAYKAAYAIVAGAAARVRG
jgi:hypothetical protein